MKRRDFIKLGGIVGAGSLMVEGCNSPAKKTLPILIAEDAPIPGAEDWFPSVCFQCPGGCGTLVRMVDGKAKKIEGNPQHPINQGKTCARGQAGLQQLYNPDRLSQPMQRVGNRGENRWQKISWAEALATVTDRLQDLRARGQSHALVFLTGALRGHRHILVSRFMAAYGSPNHIVYEPFSNTAVLTANQLNMGQAAFAVHDLENTNYLLSFGANFLETFRSPVRYNLGYGHMRQGRPGLRGRMVQVESRFSLTAANADEWVPVRPGTEGSVALALAHVLIKENLYNKDFVGSTQGFDAFKATVLAEYSPEKVAAYSGVSAERMQSVARQFASIRPSLALGGDSAAAHTNGVTAMMAVNALNALVGNLGQPGGLFFDPAPPLATLPEIKKDVAAAQGGAQPRIDRAGSSAQSPSAFSSLSTLSERMLAGQPYPVQALFLYETNPVFTEPGAPTLQKAMEKVPFVVSFSSFLDESTGLADLILPDHTPLERWVDDIPSPGVGVPLVSVAKPVLKPLYDTQATGDVLLSLAKNLGGDVAASLPWATFVDLLKASCQGLFQQKKGSVVEADFDSFWDTLLQKGGWWDPSYKTERPAKTGAPLPFQFQRPDVPTRHTMATYEGDEKDFPFYLHVYPSLALSDGRGANQPWLQELPDPMTSIAWNSWVEINPKTAAALGVKDNDWVWVESPQGKIKVPIHIYPAAMPDVVSIPVGQGHAVYGRYAQQRGANPLPLITKRVDPLSGTPAWAATRVRITKAGGQARVARIGYDRVHTQGAHKWSV